MALPVYTLDESRFGRGIQFTFRIEKGVQIEHMGLEFLDDILNTPDKNTCIPQKLIGIEKHIGQFLVGLFGESLDL